MTATQLDEHPARTTTLREKEASAAPTHNTSMNATTGIAPWRFSTRGVAVRLFVTCWLIYGLHFATNTVREIYPALSLGDHLSFDVSEYAGLHPDIFEIQGRGTFINNNPGASMLGAIPYMLAKPVIDPIVAHVKRTRAASPESTPREFDTIYPMAQEFYRMARERGLDVKVRFGGGGDPGFMHGPTFRPQRGCHVLHPCELNIVGTHGVGPFASLRLRHSDLLPHGSAQSKHLD
ncbi:MAG: hypothetical protein WKF84_22995 [Pyrinomonadaceae bacterium]